MHFFFSPLITDPDDGEMLGGQIGPGHEPTGSVEKIHSTKDIESFVCGIRVEDELDAAIENAHKNDDGDSSSGFVDDELGQGVNEDYFETEVGELSQSQEDALLFAEVDGDGQQEDLDETGDLQQEDLDLDLTRPQEPDQEVYEKEKEEEMGGRKISKESETNDTRRFEGKLSRQQELRQSETEVRKSKFLIHHLLSYPPLFRCQSCGPA